MNRNCKIDNQFTFLMNSFQIISPVLHLSSSFISLFHIYSVFDQIFISRGRFIFNCTYTNRSRTNATLIFRLLFLHSIERLQTSLSTRIQWLLEDNRPRHLVNPNSILQFLAPAATISKRAICTYFNSGTVLRRNEVDSIPLWNTTYYYYTTQSLK